ncbi:MAG: hypothetical protein WCT46_00960 [Candidatus Gracilibacteria bacterium]
MSNKSLAVLSRALDRAKPADKPDQALPDPVPGREELNRRLVRGSSVPKPVHVPEQVPPASAPRRGLEGASSTQKPARKSELALSTPTPSRSAAVPSIPSPSQVPAPLAPDALRRETETFIQSLDEEQRGLLHATAFQFLPDVWGFNSARFGHRASDQVGVVELFNVFGDPDAEERFRAVAFNMAERLDALPREVRANIFLKVILP